ncbi:unnamed protein product, partial [Echinostoma caproni]|uniref:Phosphatidylinositol-3-phosphatase SAC1 n=1 Tax=Echinostoma caproni TaxID=27848 RepID=A0A183B994_9TREM
TQVVKAEAKKVYRVRKLLSSGAFYYGRNVQDGSPYDLTVNIQNRFHVGFSFLWNIGLMTPLLQWGLDPLEWLVTIICGSVEVSTIYCGAEQARMGIISRVSSLRPGTRFHSRGVNDRGDVANFVETEQVRLLFMPHIQVRGTVPLFWEQPGIQVGSHKIHFSRGLELSTTAFERHLMNIVSHYGATAIVNLLGSKQGEAMLSHHYQELHKRSAFKVSVDSLILLFFFHHIPYTSGLLPLVLLFSFHSFYNLIENICIVLYSGFSELYTCFQLSIYVMCSVERFTNVPAEIPYYILSCDDQLTGKAP